MNTKKLFDLTSKTGFITGAARGIGKYLAESFADLGASIAIIDMDIDEAKKTAAEISEKYNTKCIALKCNVTDADDVEKAVAKVVDTFGTLDFAINNAGICNVFAAEEISSDDFKKVIDVNLNGVFITAQAAAKQMIKLGIKGSIINTASMSGHVINTPQTIANYCAAKGGVVTLTKALAIEWAKYGIRVNSVSPGYIATELVAQMVDMHEGWISRIPVGRLGTPSDLLGAYFYLISDLSTYSTGSDIIVDGGYTSL